MLADTVPNQFPATQAARRIAIVGESPGQSERSWCHCPACHHEFASEWRDQRGYHRLDYCPQCFGRTLESRPTPFSGPSGWLLNKLLAEQGIKREECFVGNCCQVQPPGNDISKFKWDGHEMQDGLWQLHEDLTAFEPHFVILLGNTPLRAFKAPAKSGMEPFAQFKGNISDWRGSLFVSDFLGSLWPSFKAVATYHPAAILREGGLIREARLDIRRAAVEARSDELEVPCDNIAVTCTKEELLLRLSLIKEQRTRISYDIEGWVDYISCIGFGTGHNDAFVVPFIKADNTSYWDNPGDEVELWEAVAAVLSDPQVPKVAQNSLYDNFVLAWSYGILVRGLVDDIMLKHFELSCESEKSLAYQTSIYTRHPFYKFERKSDDERVQLTYCGKDCCRTLECCDVQEPLLQPRQHEHYRANLQLLAPLLYMELRGIRYDKEEAQRRLAATTKRIYALQDRINREAAGSRPELAAFFAALQPKEQGHDAPLALVNILRDAFCVANPGEQREVEEHYFEPQRWNGKRWVKGGKRIPTTNHEAIEAACKAGAWQGTNAPSLSPTDKGIWLKPASKLVTKRCAVDITTLEDVKRFAKDSCRDAVRRCCQLVAVGSRQNPNGTLTPSQRGELATLLNLHLKVNATAEGGDAQWFLYEHCALPRQFKKEGGKLTTKLASDDEAIIKAWVKQKDRRAIWFLNLRQLITSTKSLCAEPDADGRIRCGYNVVGAETHRITCYGSPTGSSDLNLQTVTKGHRAIYRADDDHWMAQRDLAGADGWTVAAFMAMLGDTTMLEDYRAKLKPAQILVLMLDRGAAVNGISRDNLKPLCKPITEETDWRYFAMKRVQHGGSYMMWKNTMSDQILTDSFKKTGKPIFVPPSKCEDMLTRCLFVRYPGLPRWHAWMEREMKTAGKLVASDGFARHFYGRKDDHATVKAALSHLPQYYTTRATMLALLRLWDDADNRRADGSLRCEPLHTVHDSLVTQFHKSETEWAKVKLEEWFNNPLLIAQTVLTIPASGTYGPSWGEQDYQL